jgi:hypothetical protein
MLRIPHGDEVVSLTHRSCSTPQKHFFSFGTYFCWRLSKLQGLVRLEGLGKLKKFNDLIGSRARDFPACSIALSCNLGFILDSASTNYKEQNFAVASIGIKLTSELPKFI